MPVSQSASRGHIDNEQSPINTSSGGSSHQAAVGCGRDRQVTADSVEKVGLPKTLEY